jgi:hypothetical protein
MLLCAAAAPFLFRRLGPIELGIEVLAPTAAVALWRVRSMRLCMSEEELIACGIFVTRRWRLNEIAQFAVDGQYSLPLVVTKGGGATRIWALQYGGLGWSAPLRETMTLVRHLNGCLDEMSPGGGGTQSTEEVSNTPPDVFFHGRRIPTAGPSDR